MPLFEALGMICLGLVGAWILDKIITKCPRIDNYLCGKDKDGK